MAQITSLLNGENINQDHQITALHKALINPWIISGLAVTAGQVAVGEAFVECTRSNGEKIMVHFQNTSVLNIDTSGNKKIFVEIKQANIDNGIINAEDGSNIGEIKSAANYPSKNFIPLASVNGGNITDARELITLKNISRKWLTENGFLVVEGGVEKVISTLPESTNENIKNLVTEKINELSGTEWLEWTIQEDIPDVWTPVCFYGGWLSEEFHAPYINFLENWEEVIVKKISIYSNYVDNHYGVDVNLNMNTKSGNVTRTFNVKYSNHQNWQTYSIDVRATGFNIGQSSSIWNISYTTAIQMDRPKGFYIARAGVKPLAKIVWFIKNKRKWEVIQIQNIEFAKTIPMEIDDWAYYLPLSTSFWTKMALTKTLTDTKYAWFLQIGKIKNNVLSVDLFNTGNITIDNYIFLWFEEKQESSGKFYYVRQRDVIMKWKFM